MEIEDIKKYAIQEAKASHKILVTKEKWVKEYLRDGNFKQARVVNEMIDVDRARWGAFREIITMLDCENEYFKEISEL